MRTLFLKFDVASAIEDISDEESLDQLGNICWDWARAVTSKCKDEFPKSWETGEFSAINTKSQRNYIIALEDIHTDTGRLWKLTFTNKDLKKNISWKNTVFILSVNHRIEFSLLQEVLLPESHIGFFEEKISPPRLIRDIIVDEKFICTDRNSQDIGSNPSLTMNGQEVFEHVVDKSRVLPVIIMSKRFSDRNCLINPNKIANKLAGIAKVIVIRNLNTKVFNEMFGKQWVSNGSIRIHWPKVTPKKLFEEENYDDLFTTNKFKSSFEEESDKMHNHIVDLICKYTVSNYFGNKFADEIKREFLQEEENKRIELEAEKLQEKLLKAKNNASKQIKVLRGQVSTLQKKSGDLGLENSRLKDENDTQEQKNETQQLRISSLESELSQLKPLKHLMQEIRGEDPTLTPKDFENAWRNLVAEEDEEEPVEEEEEFESIHAAVIAAREDFGKYVLILDDAEESARKTNSDAKPSDIYNFFKFLYDSIKKYDTSKGVHFPSHKELKDEYQSKYAERESNQTMDRHKKEHNHNGRKFLLIYEGKLKYKHKAIIELQPHMKFGSKDNTLRIHFRMINRITKSIKILKLKNDNWYKEPTNDAKNNFPSNLPVAIVGWVGDHLPM